MPQMTLNQASARIIQLESENLQQKNDIATLKSQVAALQNSGGATGAFGKQVAAMATLEDLIKILPYLWPTAVDQVARSVADPSDIVHPFKWTVINQGSLVATS